MNFHTLFVPYSHFLAPLANFCVNWRTICFGIHDTYIMNFGKFGFSRRNVSEFLGLYHIISSPLWNARNAVQVLFEWWSSCSGPAAPSSSSAVARAAPLDSAAPTGCCCSSMGYPEIAGRLRHKFFRWKRGEKKGEVIDSLEPLSLATIAAMACLLFACSYKILTSSFAAAAVGGSAKVCLLLFEFIWGITW